MPRVGLTGESIVREAASVVDRLGVESLTLAMLADGFGVRPPSLYKHVSGLPALKRSVMLAAKRQFASVLTAAAVGTARADAVIAIARRYRSWAHEHPGLYALTVAAPTPGDIDDQQVSAELSRVILTVLAGFGLNEPDGVDATRYLRSTLHGFIALEAAGAFAIPQSLEHSFDRIVGCVVLAVESWGR